MSELESALEARLVKGIRVRGGMALKLTPTVAGIPDRLVIMPSGRLILVELKTDKGKLSAVQIHMHQRLALHGVKVTTLYGRDHLDKWMEQL